MLTFRNLLLILLIASVQLVRLWYRYRLLLIAFASERRRPMIRVFDLSSKNSNEEFFHESMGAIVEARVSHSQSILVQNQPF